MSTGSRGQDSEPQPEPSDHPIGHRRPAQNIEMLEAREAKLGFVTMGIALQAWNATGAWTGKASALLARHLPMYDTPFHMLVLQDPGSVRSRRSPASASVSAARRDLGRLLPGILQDIEN
jgi:hypothetical protein